MPLFQQTNSTSSQTNTPISENPPVVRRNGITVLSGNSQSLVDVVVLHGLGGCPSETWRHHATGFFWPWELRNDVADARVMLFGYNADTEQGFSTNLARIKDYARALLGDLVNKRQEDQALVEAAKAVTTKKDDWYLIYNATKGLVFFGTPHLGSGAGKQLRVQLAKMFASAALFKVPPKVDAALQMHSDELCDLANDFRATSLWTERRLEIYTYYETETDGRLGEKVVDEASARIGYDKETSQPILANHTGMVRFEDKEDSNYENVCRKLKKLRRHALNIVRTGTESVIPSYPAHAMAPIKAFVPREKLLAELKEQLWRAVESTGRRDPRKVGIWGMGGAGKSQLALSYLQHHADDYSATFWVDAQDPTWVDKCFQQIYMSLPGEKSTDEPVTADKARVAVLTWLSGRAGKWLMVFDGADELDGEDRNFVNLALYIPRAPGVHVIVTSRSQNIKHFSTFDGVEVGRLGLEEAVDLFCKSATVTLPQAGDQVRAEVEKIVEELDYLALAISIAGAYVSTVPRLRSNLSQYLEEYLRQRRLLLQRQPDKLNNAYAHSIMTVWETSYQAIHHRSPGACQLLTLLAFLDNQDIFNDLLVLGPAVPNTSPSLTEGSGSRRADIGFQDDISSSDIEEMLSLLEKYSILHWVEVDQSYSIHKLVHAWCRDRIGDDPLATKQYALAALQLLCQAIEASGPSKEAGLRLGPHVRQNAIAVSQLQTSIRERHTTLGQLQYVRFFLIDSFNARDAVSVSRISLNMHIETLGDEHPLMIGVMCSLALSLECQGKFDEALALLRDATAKSERVRGPNDKDTLWLKSILERTSKNQTAWLESQTWIEQVLSRCEQRHWHLAGLVAVLRDEKLKGIREFQETTTQALEKFRTRYRAGHPKLVQLEDVSKVLADYETTALAILSRYEVLAEDSGAIVESMREPIMFHGGFLAGEPTHNLADPGIMDELVSKADKVKKKGVDISLGVIHDPNQSHPSIQDDMRVLEELLEKAKEMAKSLEDLKRETIGDRMVNRIRVWAQQQMPHRAQPHDSLCNDSGGRYK
ncbi:uncharacterized protein DNG_01317 [Cephalotrichum gorgonifer]|uniref:NB-ARC domain-containing protein n=1 Tax=Cephalotrichum gorgonifer TaxID=2041049 RepID=A0AAE8MSC9_9PEZI|nr:uncharacterized protein DNG_01317 [Cephalotrichum gorgonifer]